MAGSSEPAFRVMLQNSPSTRPRVWRMKQREFKVKIKEHELERHTTQNHRKTTEFHEFFARTRSKRFHRERCTSE